MPAVKNVGEPCAGEPHARFEVAAGGIWRSVGLNAARALAPPADPPNCGLLDAGSVRADLENCLQVGGFRVGGGWCADVRAPQVETLWDELLPVEARELPDDLARIDELFDDPGVVAADRGQWQREVERTGRAV